MNTPERPARKYTHGDQIEILLRDFRQNFPERPVFVETGSGISTLRLARVGGNLGASIFSCDINKEKVAELKRRAGSRLDNVQFLIGDSLASLKMLSAEQPQIDFLFLDAAASAMHTFLEYQAAEASLRPGSLLLIDNAAFPGETRLLSPCRKGKVIIPYLQASEYWEVFGHPLSGDSMISAVHHAKPDYADPTFEWPDYVDPWRWSFENEWE